MNKKNQLQQLTLHIDGVFSAFYDEMLKDGRLAMFFQDDKQIINLIELQKKHFIASLSMDEEALKKTYIKLGEYHYDLKIPYIDFMKGADILEEHFIKKVDRSNYCTVIDDIFAYFKIMRSFTAKGYLNKMLIEDKKDIEMFFRYATDDVDANLHTNILSEKVQWLRSLLRHIENGTTPDLRNRDQFTKHWMEYAAFIQPEKKAFLEDLEQRITINTENLFYFLEKEEYLELLSLYTSLLSIYKLTLMINNAVTLEFANNTIESLKKDALTKLLTKAFFHEMLEKEIAMTRRLPHYKLCVAFIDVDNFKGINDSYGHITGDAVLEKLGEMMRKNIRTEDTAFRIGGDEFAIIFKNAVKEEAVRICERISKEFGSYEFQTNDSKTFHVTLSIGVNEFEKTKYESMQQFLESVDENLYKAKDAGKDTIASQ